MFNLYLTFSNLHWRKPRDAPLPPPPEGLERDFVETPGGRIEILSAKPKYPTSRTPVVFAHGGSKFLDLFISQLPCLRAQICQWKLSRVYNSRTYLILFN